MVLLGDKAQVEARFGPFGDIANPDIRLVHGFRRMYHRLRCCFGLSRWNSYVTWVMWNLVSVRLETVLVLVQDRSTVCAKCTIGSEIIFWMHPMLLLGDEAQVEARFGPFGDSANLDAR
jgi:hypothetical protein